jgi:hypothetical protein
MVQSESRKAIKVILFVVELTRSSRVQTKGR